MRTEKTNCELVWESRERLDREQSGGMRESRELREPFEDGTSFLPEECVIGMRLIKRLRMSLWHIY